MFNKLKEKISDVEYYKKHPHLKLLHPLMERTWICDNCYAHHDRDENACLNLFNYNNTKYSNNTAVGTAVNACGGNVKPKTSKKIISKKSRAVSCETRILVT